VFSSSAHAYRQTRHPRNLRQIEWLCESANLDREGWIMRFEERAAICEFDGNMSRAGWRGRHEARTSRRPRSHAATGLARAVGAAAIGRAGGTIMKRRLIML